MAVSDNKLIKGVRRFSTTIGAGGVANASATTVPLSSIPATFSDGDAIEFIVDRVSTSGALTTAYEETIVGEVSGSNVINCARGVEGTAQAHSAGAVVEIKLTADMWNRMVAWGLVEHNQDGTHKSSLTLTTPTLTSPVINTGISGTAIVDEDDMASNSATKVPTQQSVKAYVDANAGAGGKYVFIIPGTAATGTDVAGTWFAPEALTIDSVDLYLDTAGATGSMIVDLNKNGTTLFSTQGNRPTLADTATVDTGNVPDVTSAAANDKITVDIDQITTTPGVDTYVVVKYS